MKTETFQDGVAILGDGTSQEILDEIAKTLGDSKVHLVVTDPPYGNVIDETWDRWSGSQKSFADWMIEWTKSYTNFLVDGGAMYVWGGYGVPGFRPFFEYTSRVESETTLCLSNLITWSKKRAYGVQHNYLSTREDMAYLIKGNPKKPAVFNVPYLDSKRGYAGYNTKYPAKSEFYRRTNVWMDVTEIFSGKVHPTQKPLRVYEVPIETNTNTGDWIIDPFAGSMTAAFAARKLDRKWICVERDERIFEDAVEALRNGKRKR
jgi:site-specific DNA-methyltransferase (adenine-specific)